MSDNLWINLKILSKLPPYAKLNTQHELFYIEYNSLFSFTSIKRMIRGDNRSIAIKRIDKLVKESIEVLNNDSTIKTHLEGAMYGLENLKKTYSNDITTIASIDRIIDKIKANLHEEIFMETSESPTDE
jgi:hypothetical protein